MFKLTHRKSNKLTCRIPHLQTKKLSNQPTFLQTNFQTNILLNQKTVKSTNFQTKKNFKPTNFQTNKLLNQQTFKPTNFQTNNILRQKTLTSILVSWHTFNLIDFQTDKPSIWHSCRLTLQINSSNGHTLKPTNSQTDCEFTNFQADMLSNRHIYKLASFGTNYNWKNL